MTEEKLIPCPFCGGDGGVLSYCQGEWHNVQCIECGMITSDELTKAEAIAAWNTRTPDVNKEFDHLTIFKDMVTTLKNMEWTGSPQMCAMCGEYKHHGHNSECSFVGTINKAYSQLENAIKQAEAVI